jgi:hypothetical protein
MIAGMMRALTGLAAWLAGTTLAVGLAWFGAGMVVRSTGMSPNVPVISAVSAQPTQQAQPASPAGGTPPTTGGPGPRTTARGPSPSATRPATPAATVKTTAAAGTTPTAAGTTHGYTLTGGHVTLLVTQGTVELVSAVPDPGYAVQNWSGTGWLRVDFSSGTQVSSLIASWFEHPLSVTITN